MIHPNGATSAPILRRADMEYPSFHEQSIPDTTPTVITLVNPWSKALVKRDITDLTQEQLDAYPLDEDICNELHAQIAPCSPADFLAAYVDRVGPEAAGIVIIGS